MSYLYLLLLLSFCWAPPPPFSKVPSLVNIADILDKTPYPACSRAAVKKCTMAQLDLNLLKMGEVIQLPEGLVLNVTRRGDNFAVFQSPGEAEAVFTWVGEQQMAVAGHLQWGNRSCVLQGCGKDCYLWLHYSGSWKPEASLPREDKDKGGMARPQSRVVDTTSLVTYSMMFWYTPEFRATFPAETDMAAFIDLIIVETNQGYVNSQMPIRVVKFNVKAHPTLHDMANSTEMINAFEASMPSWELNNCADAAALLINDFDSCGIAKYDTTSSCRTISITTKDCATGYYSFGHEVGHNLGATHNREASTGEYNYPDGYGHLILPKAVDKDGGYRTIMAYSSDGHATRVNYYSNPSVLFPVTGTATGLTGINDNARVMVGNRFMMAACGNEESNGSCTPTSCCDKVTFTTTDEAFLALYGGYFASVTFLTHPTTPTINFRSAYIWAENNYCLWYAFGSWKMGDCSHLGSSTYNIKTESTNSRCVSKLGLLWGYYNGSETVNAPTMEVACNNDTGTPTPVTPCCDTISFSSTDQTFLGIYSSSFSSALFLRHPDNATINDRPAYIGTSQLAIYCIWYSNSAWRIGQCAKLGSGSYNIKTQNTIKKCATDTELSWSYYNGTGIVGDSTMKTICAPDSCCDAVTFTTTDETFLAVYGGFFASVTFFRHPTTPTINDRSAYIWPDNNYCLWYISGSWSMGACSNLGTGTYNIQTATPTARCVTQTGLLWGYYNGSATVTAPSMEVACSTSTQPPVTPCCDTPTFSSTDKTFLGLYGSFFSSALFERYPDNATINERPAYLGAGGFSAWCLWYSVSAWRLGKCSDIGTGSYSMKTQSTVKKCPSDPELSWNYYNGQMVVSEPTMKIACILASITLVSANSTTISASTRLPQPNTDMPVSLPPAITVVPPEISSIPSEMSSIPSGMSSTPSIITGFPPQITSFASEVSSIPTVITGIPPEIISIPSEMSSIPPMITGFPLEITSIPSEMNSIPPVITGIPQEIPSIPSEMSSIPPVITGIPTMITSIESEMSSISPVITGFSLEITSIPSEITGFPLEITSSPSQMSSIPPVITGFRPEIISIPTEMSSIPPNITGNPQKITSIQSEMSSIPPVITGFPPEITSILSELSSIPPVITGNPPEITSIQSEMSSIPPVNTGFPPEITSIPSEMSSIPPVITESSLEITSIPPLITGFPPEITNISLVISSIPLVISEITPTMKSDMPFISTTVSGMPLSMTVVMQPSKMPGMPICQPCKEITSGPENMQGSYTLMEAPPLSATSSCKDSCVYRRELHLYCFAQGGQPVGAC